MTDDRTRTSDPERPRRPESALERRSSSDTQGSGQRPLVSFDARLPRVDRSPLVPVIALSVLVAVAIVTSRAAVPGTPPDPSGAALRAAADRSREPSTAPPDPADQAIAAICLEPGSWRTATIETWRDQTVHVWRAVDPAPASGPDDPVIPLVPAVGNRIDAIGFCAPVVGPDRPSGPATVQAWRLSNSDQVRPDSTTTPAPIDLTPLVPTGTQSAFGGLYRPPDALDAGNGWPAGIVVIRYSQAGEGSAPTAVWFGIEIALSNPPGARPSPSVTASGPTVPAESPRR